STLAVMSALHQLGYGGFGIWVLYFVGGLAGCALAATGLILFTVKRKARPENEFGEATPRVYRTIESLNVIFVTGISIGCAALFWINRLVPIGMPDRMEAEMTFFTMVWGAAALHALLRPPAKAWREQA